MMFCGKCGHTLGVSVKKVNQNHLYIHIVTIILEKVNKVNVHLTDLIIIY